MASIPVKYHDPNAMLTEAAGLVYLEGNVLVLEYEKKDVMLGAYRSGVKTVEIPMEELGDVRYVKNIFKSELVIETRSMTLVEDVPGNKQGRLRLKVPRKHWEDAAALSHELQNRIKFLEDGP